MSSANVADLMGHADTRMVETVYARTRHEGVMKQKDAVETLNLAFAKSAKQSKGQAKKEVTKQGK